MVVLIVKWAGYGRRRSCLKELGKSFNISLGMTRFRDQIKGVPLTTEPGISLIILPLMRILDALQTHTADTFLFISHTTNVLLFKFRCNIFIGVRIIKEMPGSVASGTKN